VCSWILNYPSASESLGDESFVIPLSKKTAWINRNGKLHLLAVLKLKLRGATRLAASNIKEI
jgi:hypothetical protein